MHWKASHKHTCAEPKQLVKVLLAAGADEAEACDPQAYHAAHDRYDQMMRASADFWQNVPPHLRVGLFKD